MPNHLTIPIQLIELALKQNILPELKVFVGAKMVSPGFITDKSIEFNQLCDLVGLKRRTILKHLNHLVGLEWVGYDLNANKYYIRSWAWFRSKEIFFKHTSVTLTQEDLPNFRAFLASAVITAGIRTQQYCQSQREKQGIEKTRRKGKPYKSAILIRGIASQDKSVSPNTPANHLPYFGYSNQRIAALLSFKLTRACEIKHEAEKAGYLKTRPHYLLLQEFDEPVSDLRHSLNEAFGDDALKMRLLTRIKGGKTVWMLVKQLHDEIIPVMQLKRINYRQKAKQHHRKSVTPVIPVVADAQFSDFVFFNQ